MPQKRKARIRSIHYILALPIPNPEQPDSIWPQKVPTRSAVQPFIQDDWKVSPKLTVNLGLRWEFGNTERERFDRVTGVDYSNGDFEIPVTRENQPPQLAPQYPVEYVNNPTLLLASNKNIGPRIGIAYQLFPKTVLRTGFGIFYGYPYNAGTLAMPLNPPWGPDVFIQPPNYTRLSSS